MLEYSVLVWVLLVALVLGSTARIIPAPRGRQSVVELFFRAHRSRYDSFYFMLNSALP